MRRGARQSGRAWAVLALVSFAGLLGAGSGACSAKPEETSCEALGSCLDADFMTTCDPTLPCEDTVTCSGGELYPTNCGPENCDAPLGPCDVDAGPCPATVTGGEACAASGQSCPLGCTECGPGSYQRVIDMLCTCITGQWSCGDADLHCGADTVGTYEDPSCSVLRVDAAAPPDTGPADAGSDSKEKKELDSGTETGREGSEAGDLADGEAPREGGSNLDAGPPRDL